MGKIIIAMGTGRCGTMSFSNMLDSVATKSNGRFLHEGGNPDKISRNLLLGKHLPWAIDESMFYRRMRELEKHGKNAEFFGDTAFYYLPYADLLLDMYPDIKIVGLVRKKGNVVESFANLLDGVDRWVENEREPWNKSFPNYSGYISFEKKIGRYCDEYNDRLKLLQKCYPDKVKLFSIESMHKSTKKGLLQKFLKIDGDLDMPKINVGRYKVTK